MTKFRLNGKSMAMVLSFFAFMILGSVSASAQFVTPEEAVGILKTQITTLEDEIPSANTTEEQLDLAFELKFYHTLFVNIAEEGMEVGTAITASKPTNKPEQHSSGLIYFSAQDENFKNDAQALVDEATDLLSD